MAAHGANPYWSIYKNLEKELLELTNSIYFCYEHFGVYSVKIAELLLRCVVEIESISKDLWKQESGIATNGSYLKFDSDCLKFLDKKWMLGKKEVVISSETIDLKDEHKILAPLKNAGEMVKKDCRMKGAKGEVDCACCANWNNAYQNVKHNRVEGLPWANVKHLIDAMAALFVLNLYYRYPRNGSIYSVSPFDDADFDPRCSSKLFTATIGNSRQDIFFRQQGSLQINVNQPIHYYKENEDGYFIVGSSIETYKRYAEEIDDYIDDTHEVPFEREQADR